MNERPYINLSIHELQALALRSTADIGTLFLIHEELLHRRRKKARELEREVLDTVWKLIQSFPWPDTEAPEGDGRIASPMPPAGVLSRMGYAVGKSGLSQRKRREVLDRVFNDELPFLNSDEYMSQWGLPSTPTRLRKMAESLAAFARNAKRNSPESFAFAIEHWEEDLDYLKMTYYLPSCVFGWPTTQPE
jgi:hypothetical protein